MQEMQEICVQCLGWEDPMEKEMATHSSILTWKIPWTEDWWATVHGVIKSQTMTKLQVSLCPLYNLYHICILMDLLS